VEHIARVPARHPDVVAAGRHYGITIRTCVPADPQTKGGSEATVRAAKADLVLTEANLRAEYASLTELEAACAAFGAEIGVAEAIVAGCTSICPTFPTAAEPQCGLPIVSSDS